MNYEDLKKEMDKYPLCKVVRMLSEAYENKRRENLVKWAEDHPKYWEGLCWMDKKSITPEYAAEVMESLMNSHIIELQIYWLCRCSDKLSLEGKMTDEVI